MLNRTRHKIKKVKPHIFLGHNAVESEEEREREEKEEEEEEEHIGRTNSNRPTGPYEAVCDRD